MTADPTWRGTAIDAQTALALLQWQIELGADEPCLDAPVDRHDLPRVDPARAGAGVAAGPAPAAAGAPGGAAAAHRGIPAPGATGPGDGDDIAAHLALAERMAAGADSLEALAAAQQAFEPIELRRGARSFCFADGRPGARVMVIGEAPGEEEDIAGRPFVGRAGRLLDRMFAAIGLSRDAPDAERAIYITNVLPWRPPGNRRPDEAEIAMMLPFLRRHVELADPELLVLMGNTPCIAALGKSGILRLRGAWTQAFGRPALPMTHPAYLLRTPLAKRDAWADLLSLAERLDQPPRP